MITTRREWLMILDATNSRFDSITTDGQKKTFSNFCAKKFPNGSGMSDETVDEIKSSVYLILEFVYGENIKW